MSGVPKWSNDGRWLYYVSNRGSTMDLWRQKGYWVMERRAVSRRTVTRGLGIRSAALSADGRRIAYGRGRMITNVWRVAIRVDEPAEWRDAVHVTSERAFIEFVDVSTDGKLLALSSDRRGNRICGCCRSPAARWLRNSPTNRHRTGARGGRRTDRSSSSIPIAAATATSR